MRFNPRIVAYCGPYNKNTDRHKWRTGGLVGLTVRDWRNLLDVVAEYRQHDSQSSNSPDYESYNAEQNAILEKISGWLREGPKPFDKTKQGLYRSRGDEVVLLLDGYHEIKSLFTQASLRFSDTIDTKAVDYDILNERESDRKILSPDRFATKYLGRAVEKLIDANRDHNFDEEDKPIIQRSASSIRRRRETILHDRKFRVDMAAMFARMDAQRNGTDYVEQPIPERVAPARPVYVRPEQRPIGKSYDLPVPKVQIGDKLRLSFGRGPEIQYYKQQLVRAQLRSLRAIYAENPNLFGNPVKIIDGNKNQIREIIRVIESAYEIEVAGVIAHPSHPGVSNQCYIGGGSGCGGISYGCAILFRAEQPNDQPDRPPNQVQYLLHEFCVPDYHVERYLMERE